MADYEFWRNLFRQHVRLEAQAVDEWANEREELRGRVEELERERDHWRQSYEAMERAARSDNIRLQGEIDGLKAQVESRVNTILNRNAQALGLEEELRRAKVALDIAHQTERDLSARVESLAERLTAVRRALEG